MDGLLSHHNAPQADSASTSDRTNACTSEMEEAKVPERLVLEVTLNVHKESITLASIRQAYTISSQGIKTMIPKHCQEHTLTSSPERMNSGINAGSEEQFAPSDISLDRSVSKTDHALDCLRFINRATHDKDSQELWKDVEARFHKLAKADGVLSRESFAYIIDMEESEEFALQLLDAYTRQKGLKRQLSTISKEVLQEFWLQITEKSFRSRIQIFFDFCDTDADGRLTEDEVKEVILLSATANKLDIPAEQAEEYAALIMEELDQSLRGYIELSQLEALFRDGFLKETQRNQSQLMQRTLSSGNVDARGPWRKARGVVMTGWKRRWMIWLWVACMCALFIWKFNQYKYRTATQVMGYCLCTAKGAAETLKLNMALILLPVCRNTITWLRSTFLGNIIPVDDNLNFHKLIAIAIMFGVILHGGTHLTCDFPRIVTADEELFSASVGTAFSYKPSYGEIMMTPEVLVGIAMVVIMSFAFVLALRQFRQDGAKLPRPLQRLAGFNAFWYSHHLFILVYVLLIYHSFNLFFTQHWSEKTTLMYISLPILLYAGERTLQAIRSAHLHRVHVIKVNFYPGDVLGLYMTKPDGFKYKSGMYLFLKCPKISSFEWHPFSFTSSPGDDYLSIHIRVCGDWTRSLIEVFSHAVHKHAAKVPNYNHSIAEPMELYGSTIEDDEEGGNMKRFPRLLVDGPYGAPAQQYMRYDVMLLVGLGIGVTPFISILKDVVNNMREKSNSKDSRRPRNIYSYWVTREQSSFEWFKEVMNEVAEFDKEATIEMHNHLTSVYEEGDARSALITMVQALHHARNGVDIVSGTRVRTHFARPNWHKVFTRLAAKHPTTTIGVFYCGPTILTKELSSLSHKLSQTSKTKFIFHRENF